MNNKNFSYPEIKVEEENLYYADLLSVDYARNTGEISAILMYLFESFEKFKENKEFSKIMESIAKDEMLYLNLLGKTIKLLGKSPKYKTCSSNLENCIFWSFNNINYETNIKEMIKANILSEKAAIRSYKEHKKIIKDKYINSLLDKIIIDEERHLKIFDDLYNSM